MKKKSRNTILIVVFILLAIVAVTVYALVNTEVKNDGQKMAANENSDDFSIAKYKNGFAVYDGTALRCYDSAMNEEWTLDIKENDAALYVNGSYILLLSKSTDNVYLVKNGSIVSDFKSPKSVRSGSVNENGYICILTSDKGYKGQCTVYSSGGKKQAEYSYGEKYIITAGLSKNNKSLMLSIVDETENSSVPKLLFTDVKSGKDICEVQCEEISSYSKYYRDSFIVSDSKKLKCYSKGGKEKWSYEYGEGEPEYINTGGGCIAVTVKTGQSFGSTETLIFTLSGRLKGKYVSDAPVDAVDMSGAYTAICSNNSVVLLDSRARQTDIIKCGMNTMNIMLYKNKNRVITMSGTDMTIEKFGR